MALRSTLTTADWSETTHDVTNVSRNGWTIVDGAWVMTVLGVKQHKEVHTTSVWVANTEAAVDAYIAAYAGTGSLKKTLESRVTDAWMLTLDEVVITDTWVPEE